MGSNPENIALTTMPTHTGRAIHILLPVAVALQVLKVQYFIPMLLFFPADESLWNSLIKICLQFYFTDRSLWQVEI